MYPCQFLMNLLLLFSSYLTSIEFFFYSNGHFCISLLLFIFWISYQDRSLHVSRHTVSSFRNPSFRNHCGTQPTTDRGIHVKQVVYATSFRKNKCNRIFYECRKFDQCEGLPSRDFSKSWLSNVCISLQSMSST